MVLADVKPGTKHDNGGGGWLLFLGVRVLGVYTTTRVPQFIKVWHRQGQSGQLAVGSRRRGGGWHPTRLCDLSACACMCACTLHFRHRVRTTHLIQTWQLFFLPSPLLSISLLCFLSLLSFQQDYLQGDSSKAHKILGWRPKVTFEVRCRKPGEVKKNLWRYYKHRLGISWGNWNQPQGKQCPKTEITRLTPANKDLLWLS